ncbi:ribonuclease J [Candidatus Saccharibacteria bacterium]|nr:ribonuclease J [Candidatus Saccharibacteria bacterium]
MNQQEQERRARLMEMSKQRLPKIKKDFEERQKNASVSVDAFEEVQNRHFNSNFEKGGKDAHLTTKTSKKARKTPQKANSAKKPVKNPPKQPKKASKKSKKAKVPEERKVNLSVSTRKGEMVHHQRMLSQDVNAQATQHIIGIPVNKSRYNGYEGTQVTHARLKSSRPDPDAVRIIPIGGVGEFGIGKNMTVVEYKSEMIIIDMGVLFAGDDYPGVNYLIPDIKYLEDNRDKVKAILFTHAHLDHIGACRHLLPKFDPLTPIYGTEYTIGMIKKQMSELDDVPELNYQTVKPLEHVKYQVSEHMSVEFIHVLHSIPGSTAIVVRTPNGTIYFSGDWRAESNPMGTQADYARMDEIVNKEGIALMVNESTNIESPGHHPHSEYDIQDSFGRVMDHYASGRIIVSCFSSQVSRIQSVLKDAADRGRKVAFAGFSMINNVEVALRAREIKVPKDTIMKMEDIVKLPDDKVTIVCTGSQGELNAVLNRMVTGAHKYIKIKPTDTIVFSSNPIPGNEPHVTSTVDGLLREGAQVIQNGKTQLTNIGPLHLSGHAYYEEHVDLIERLQPLNYMPYHGEFHMLEHSAEMAENVIGIPRERIIVSDDGDIVELLPNKTIRKNGRIHSGNKLYDDADQPVHEAVVKDRIHISREGIFVIILTLSKKTGHLVKTPDIVSRAFIYLDNSEELIGKIRHYLRQKTDKSISSDPDLKVLKDEIKDDVTHILFDATGHTPIVIPVINKV